MIDQSLMGYPLEVFLFQSFDFFYQFINKEQHLFLLFIKSYILLVYTKIFLYDFWLLLLG